MPTDHTAAAIAADAIEHTDIPTSYEAIKQLPEHKRELATERALQLFQTADFAWHRSEDLRAYRVGLVWLRMRRGNRVTYPTVHDLWLAGCTPVWVDRDTAQSITGPAAHEPADVPTEQRVYDQAIDDAIDVVKQPTGERLLDPIERVIVTVRRLEQLKHDTITDVQRRPLLADDEPPVEIEPQQSASAAPLRAPEAEAEQPEAEPEPTQPTHRVRQSFHS